MSLTITEKIMTDHLVAGSLKPGQEIALKIDQTLTQDATGTLAYLQLEALGLQQLSVDTAVSYVDHNTLQTGPENADDHLFLQSVAAHHGLFFSPPGRGICHQVHLERFGRPGFTLLGADSHTPTAGGLGMLAMGAGGLSVAAALAGEPYYLEMPRLTNIRLEGHLPPWVSAKDIILKILARLTVRGGKGQILEYSGPGVNTLSVPERATIANMGAETGCTTSLFPSDEATLAYLKDQGRGRDWRALSADPGALYDETITVNLSHLEPLVAQPHSPDNVVPVAQLHQIEVQQVIIGSCTNASFPDLWKAAQILEGQRIHSGVNLVIIPGSQQVLRLLASTGALDKLVAAGARLLEPACGPCIGMGQAPPTDSVSLRTFNRNFRGRSGTPNAQVYLASPEVAAVSALKGVIADPRREGERITLTPPPTAEVPRAHFLEPDPALVGQGKIIKGPNIKPCPLAKPLADTLEGEILLKCDHNITTDDILPAGAKLLPLRSNIPALAEHAFSGLDPHFSSRAREVGGGFILAGENYGQGSSREHAALVPLYLGVKGVIALSFARIHRSNLIGAGLLPLHILDAQDYEALQMGTRLHFPRLRQELQGGKDLVTCHNLDSDDLLTLGLDITRREREVLLHGGLLNFIGSQADGNQEVQP